MSPRRHSKRHVCERFIPTSPLYGPAADRILPGEWVPGESARRSVSLCPRESYYDCTRLQRQNLAVRPGESRQSCFVMFITDGPDPETSSQGALTLINGW